ncbi:transposase IS200 like protein [Clostridium acetireducens DSM 10703]|uniref:Transposase IS200 like protein n=1 Tax=Clostridium acetireducens DSM 10703 TaxID=1121290 RepID=A0A1E8F063_9CLOT|nr:transposase [Clostridium acetireducens]OFI06776.1 transposase IS200 like protein [Clostridium acetireducens DSM 10703]
MPRTARIKISNGVYHVIVRSIKEIKLFRNNLDKKRYLNLMNKYKKIFLFNVYSFCLMNTHAHFIINSNGADISKFMHNINQCYARYYNKKYDRHGPVFAERFKSIIIKDDKYLLCLSAYIHNNPKDIFKYKNNVDKYKFSSFKDYISNKSNGYLNIDTHFILKKFSLNIALSKKLYENFVYSRIGLDPKNNSNFNDFEQLNIKTEYRSELKPIIRNISPNKIIDFTSNYLKINSNYINIKYNRKLTNFRCLCALLMRSLCNFSYKQICHTLGNITCSHISNLCNKGFYLMENKYKNIIFDFINSYS